MCQRVQPFVHSFLHGREPPVVAGECIAAMARRALNQAQFCASLAHASRQVIRTLGHFTGSREAAGYFLASFLSII